MSRARLAAAIVLGAAAATVAAVVSTLSQIDDAFDITLDSPPTPPSPDLAAFLADERIGLAVLRPSSVVTITGVTP